MSWDGIIGQERVKELLRQAVTSRRVAHAYLLEGPEGIGKEALAIEFARVLNCEKGLPDACGKCDSCRQMDVLQHPNVRLIFALPTGKNERKGDDPIQVLTEDQVDQINEQVRLKSADLYHRIEIPRANFIKVNSIRELKREASMSQAGSGKKVLLLFRADEMNAESANSLLKTLEEPLADTILVLTTTDRDALLPTVVSRCQVLRCHLLSEADIAENLMTRDSIDPDRARLAAVMSNGSFTAARDLVSENIQAQYQEVVGFVRLALGRSHVALATEIERLTGTYDRPALERWLRLLSGWLRDALLFRERETLPLAGDAEALKRFVERFPDARLVEALNAVDGAIAHLNKNVYLHLLLTQLAVELRGLIDIRRRAPSPV